MNKVYREAKRKNGEVVKVPVLMLSLAEMHDLDSQYGGMCLSCGEVGYGVEPDAIGYKCEMCGENKVCGLEVAVLYGRAIQEGEEE